MVPVDRNLTSAPFTVGRFEVRPDTNSLHTGSEAIRLEPLVVDVLVTLARAAPATVSRETLLEEHWPEHVTEDALNRVIWKLRKALDGCQDGEAIETVPKKGYRLAASVGVPAVEDSKTKGPGRWLLGAGLAVAVVGLLWSTWEGGGTSPGAPENVADSIDVFRPITSLIGYESSPSFSPDGSKVVFSHYAKTGERKGQIDVYELDLETGKTHAVTETVENELSPIWSPDGESIAFVRVAADSCDLFVHARSDGSERRLGGCGPERDFQCCPELAWKPEGDRIAVSDRQTVSGPTRIRTIDLVSGESRIVTDPPAQSEGDRSPKFSRGDTIAFVRSRAPGLDDIWVRSLANGNERRLTFEHQPLAGLALTGDGREAVFSSRKSGVFRLYRIALSGGPVIAVDTVGINATSPALKDGMLIYEEWRSEINIWSVPLEGDAEASPFIQSSIWDWNPSWSPTGDRVAFLSNRSGATEVWVASPDGTGTRRLTDLGASFASPLRWSPDGRRIAFAAPAAGNFDVFAVEADSGAVERLTMDASDERDPIWCADGSALYFGSNRTSREEIWRLDLGDGALTQVTANGGREPRLSIDGTRLFFTRYGEPNVLIRDLATGHEEIAVSRPSARDAPWEVFGDGVAWIEPDSDGRYRLWHQILGGSRTTIRVLEGPDSAIDEIFAESTLSFSPDGHLVLVGAIDRSDSDLWAGRW